MYLKVALRISEIESMPILDGYIRIVTKLAA